ATAPTTNPVIRSCPHWAVRGRACRAWPSPSARGCASPSATERGTDGVGSDDPGKPSAGTDNPGAFSTAMPGSVRPEDHPRHHGGTTRATTVDTNPDPVLTHRPDKGILYGCCAAAAAARANSDQLDS